MEAVVVRPDRALAEASADKLTGALKGAVGVLGADLVGVADPALLENLPEERRPQSVFPEVSAVVVVGKRITRGTLRGIEEGTNWNTFDLFGRKWLEDQFLASTAFELVCWLEDLGFEACPVFSYPPDVPPMGLPVAEGRPAPNIVLDPRPVAIACGLGEVGRMGELLTPEFGPLQRLSLILTDAPLEFDRPRSFGFCEECTACAEGCPLDAVRPESVREANGWKEFGIEEGRCAACRNGAFKSRFVGSEKVERTAAACMRACLESLEKRGLLERRFANPFRLRKPWSVNAFGEVDAGGRE